MEPALWDLPLADLDAGIERSAEDLITLRGSRILITGGTGFLGSWLVASLLRAGVLLKLDLKLVVLTRDPSAVPIAENSMLSLLRGDVRSLPDPGFVDFIVHGAATSSSIYGLGDGDPRRMAETIIEGTQSVIAAGAKYRARLLFLSSGAVYGPQIGKVAEDCLTAPDPMDPRSAYGQAKRMAETLCVAATEAGEVSAVVARLFAFVGPRIPLDVHFAAGNFIRDALDGRQIIVRGDGRPRRSYLYTGDLPEWSWALAARGRPGVAYNVGSPEPVTIEELARKTANIATTPVEIEVLAAPDSASPPWYVPCTERSQEELGLSPRTGLDDALRKTFDWFSEHPQFRR